MSEDVPTKFNALNSKPLDAAAILEKGREKRPYLVTQVPIHIGEQERLGVIPKNSYTLLIAPSGHGKTWIALDLARLMATPRERRPIPLNWLGRYDVEPCRVLYLAEENGEPLIGERLRQLGLEGNADLLVWSWSKLKLPNTTQMEEIIGFCKERKFDVVILDSLVRFHREEENNAQAMAEVADRIRDLVAAGLTVIALHHTRKGTAGEQVDRQRGSGELTAGADTVLFLENWQSEPAKPLQPWEQAEWDMFTLSATKLRYADKKKFSEHRFRRQKINDRILFVSDDQTKKYKKPSGSSSTRITDVESRDDAEGNNSPSTGTRLSSQARSVLQRAQLLNYQRKTITLSSIRGSKAGDCPGCGQTKQIPDKIIELVNAEKLVEETVGSRKIYRLAQPFQEGNGGGVQPFKNGTSALSSSKTKPS